MIVPVKDFWRRILEVSLVGFSFYVLRRFFWDDCPRTAASLSYSTLLSLIPFLAVLLSVLSFLPRFEGVYATIQEAMLANFLPELGQEVQQQMTLFVQNARTISGVGFIVLIGIIHIMLSHVMTAFNRIWRVVEPRAIFARVAMQWFLMLVGPTLLGLSIYFSSYAFAMVEWAGLDDYAQSFYLSRFLPFMTAVAAFGCLYVLLPSRKVRIQDAAIGALFAGILFEFLKSGFGIYLRHFPSYEIIYGALATIPVFLVWTYLLWVVIFAGAELTAALPEWRVGRNAAGREQGPARRIAVAVCLLRRLWESRGGREGLHEPALIKGLPAEPGYLSDVLARLRRAGLIRRRNRRWIIAPKASELSLADLVAAIGLSWEPVDDWPSEAREAVALWMRDPEDAKRQPLQGLLDGAGTGGAASTKLEVDSADRDRP